MLIIKVVIRTLAILTRLYSTIGHSPVASSRCFKGRLSAKPLM